jgi:hypothetical protein
MAGEAFMSMRQKVLSIVLDNPGVTTEEVRKEIGVFANNPVKRALHGLKYSGYVTGGYIEDWFPIPGDD